MFRPLKYSSHIDMNSLNLGISRQTSFSQLSSNTTLLHTTKGNSIVRVVAAVDPNHTRLNPLCNAMSPCNILGKNRTTKTVCCIVCHIQCLFFGLEARNNHERSKDFFTVDLHAGFDTSKDSGMDEITLIAGRALSECFTSRNESCAFVFADFYKSENAIILCLGDLGALEGSLCEWIAYDGCF